MVGKIKLAVLEDNEIFKQAFLEFSKKYSFEVTAFCKNSKDLLKQIEGKQPQAIILDLVIPEEDTLELIPTLKKAYPDLVLIVCSSLREEHIVSRALKAGCFDYIFKPFNEEALAQAIKNGVLKEPENS